MKLSSVFLMGIAVLLVIVPAAADVVSFQAPASQAVWALNIEANVGSSGTAYIHLQNNDTIEAAWSYTGYPVTTATTTIGSDTESFTYIQPVVFVPLQMQIWNGDNVTYARQLKLGSGQSKGIWNRVVETTIDPSPIIGYDIVSSDRVTVSHELVPYSTAAKSLNAEKPIDIFSQIQTYLPMLWSIFTALIYWLKFLFIDYLILTVSLYITGSLAYAMNTSRNIFAFYKTWFRQQAALFNFISGAFSTTVSIVTQVLGVLGSVLQSVLNKIM